MTRFDSHLRKRLQKETPRMPAGMAARFDDTLSALEKPPARHSAAFRILRLAAVVLALVLFVLPNINPTIAYAMQEIPILGDLISVFTVYKLEESNEYHYQDVQIPQIEATDDGNSAIDYINADVEALANAAIAEYEATVEKYPDAHTGLLIDYDVITNTRDWFTIRLMVFREAGSSSVQYYFYHIDKQKGELVQLSDLFREDYDYRKIFSDEIRTRMREQMEDNPNLVYWVDAGNGANFVFDQIDENQNFYFDSDGNLVIVFGKYEVAPGYMGCPEFPIPTAVYTAGLA